MAWGAEGRMPPVRPIKWKQFDKILTALGWVFDRQNGSHKIYKKPGEIRPIVLPDHGDELKAGTIKSNLRTLKISNARFEQLRNEHK